MGHTSWEDLKAEWQPDIDAWRRDHPVRAWWTGTRMKIRLWVYRLTRADIG